MSATKLRDTSCTLTALVVMGILLTLAQNHLDTYSLQILNLVAINAILAVSLNLIYGFTGMFSLGHAGFMAIGAYVCTLCILSPDQKTSMWILEEIQPWLRDLSLPFILAVPLSGFVAALFGLIIAVPVLRLGGDYLGIATLGFAEIIRVVITNASSVTNGSLGIKGIPQYATIGWNYAWLVITVYCITAFLRSNIGNVFKAIRDNEIAARTMGINTFKYRVISFCIGAFFAGVGGALLAALISTIDPKMFNFMFTFSVLMIVVAGGLGSITGSILSSVVITIMLEWLRIVESAVPIKSIVEWLPFGQTLAEYTSDYVIPGVSGMRMVIFSILLMAIILFRRTGMMGTREFSWEGVITGTRNVFERRQQIKERILEKPVKHTVLAGLVVYFLVQYVRLSWL